jgi:AmmeMemoRadiSam system protein B
MSTETQAPNLRTDIEIFPTYYQGQKVLVVRDVLGLIKNPVVLQGQILVFIGLIDGKRTPRDIQLELIRQQNGVFMSVEDVHSLLSELDSLFLLDSDHYRDKKNKIFNDYFQLKVRPAVLAGQAYPDSIEALRKYLDSFSPEMPGEAVDKSSKKVTALIAPHIDLRVGKKVYAQAYAAVKEAFPKTVVLLGTGHSLYQSYFSLTEKDFETPLGLVKTDKAFVRKLKEVGKKAVVPHDIDHRNEHSIEFQLIFLQHLFGSDFTLIPVLCGSLDNALSVFSCASEIPGVNGILCELRKFVEERGSETLVVAGVDFSHIGPKFGHSFQASSLIREAKDFDTRLIEAICRGDASGLWAEARRVNNRYNVCGFSSIACLLEILPKSVGHCLAYDFWEEEETQSAVSYAAITLSPASESDAELSCLEKKVSTDE